MEINIKFQIKDQNDFINIKTSSPELIFGVTYVYISPNHEVIQKYKKEITNYNDILNSQEIKLEGFNIINPLSNKILDVYIKKEEKNISMAVPAHNQNDFEFAIRHNIEIIPVIKQITGTPKEDEKYKKSIVAVLRNTKTNKYLTLNWGEKLGGRLLIGGSIKEGEKPIDCAIREIKEETGYINFKFVRKIFPINHHYFAFNKNQAYNIDCIGFLFDLIDESKQSQELEKEETFKIEWETENKVKEEIKDELHKTVFENTLNPKPYLQEGVMVNSGFLNGIKDRKEAKDLIIQHLNK